MPHLPPWHRRDRGRHLGVSAAPPISTHQWPPDEQRCARPPPWRPPSHRPAAAAVTAWGCVWGRAPPAGSWVLAGQGSNPGLLHYRQIHRQIWAFLLSQFIRNLPAMQESLVRFLGQEDPLENELSTHPSFWPGESHGQKSLLGYSPWGHKSWTWLRD